MGEADKERLCDALRNIKTATNWYWVCAGAISRGDLVAAMESVRRELESVNDLLFPVADREEHSRPMNNDF